VPARFAAAKQAGATEDEIMEALYYAMRGRARAAWSTIKHIDGVEDLNKKYEAKFKDAAGK
jgi:alkylhydroperoxidase/carboxymuconolactone decarboxylase family protein YurZ